MENTGRYDLPLIMPQQAQKHVTHNEALTLVDGLLHLAIKSFGENSPPPTAQIDDAFIVGAAPTGAWFGEQGNLAINTTAGWRFVAPRQGMLAQDLTAGGLVLFDQGIWSPLGDTLEISSLSTLGINTSADATNRLSLRSNAALLTAINAGEGGNGAIQVKLNKETASDTGSLLYQTGFSGRAEIGLAGNDDLSIKVSPDGASWIDALSIDRTNGQVALHANSVGNAALADMATGRLKGRATVGNGAPEDLTAAQATSLLNAFTSALKGLAPASGGGTVNFLRADGTWAAPAGGGGSNDPLDLASVAPGAPAAGTVRLFRKDHASRQMPAFIGPSGMDATVQPFLATNKIARWNPAGNVTTVPIIDGFAAAFTALGTATARSVAATNFITRLRRFGYVSAATAGALCGHYATVAQWTIGNGSGLGGFHYVCRFVPSDAAPVAGARMFVGLRNLVTAPANVEPSTLTNCLGVAQLSTSGNLHVVYGGSAAQVAIDLGASFPANGASTAAFELELFGSPMNSNIGYKVTRLDTGDAATGTLAGTAGTQLPGTSTFLAHTAWRCNNTTLLACGLDVVGVYIETDN